VLLAAASVACAWFALGIRQETATKRAQSIVGRPGKLTPSQARRAMSLLRAAAQLNPDTRVDLLQAQVALRLGTVPRARRILTDVVRREPSNLAAWAFLRFVGTIDDPQLARRATAELLRLSPPAPPP
jgi:hypothetical protein